MEGDGEAVYFGLDLLEETEDGTMMSDRDLTKELVAVEEGGGAMTFVLDKSSDRDLQL